VGKNVSPQDELIHHTHTQKPKILLVTVDRECYVPTLARILRDAGKQQSVVLMGSFLTSHLSVFYIRLAIVIKQVIWY
jgi:hypothetical protein